MARRTCKTKKQKRIARGPKRRHSGSRLRTHPKTRRKAGPKLPRKRSAARKRPPAKLRSSPRNPRNLNAHPRAEAAVLEMNRGRSLTAAARDSHLSSKQLQNYLKPRRLLMRKGTRWVLRDNRPRRVPVMTGGRFRVLTVRGYKEARLVDKHHRAVGEFVRTNSIQLIKPFEGRTVQTVSGRKYPLETSPNALHRIAAMDSPPFHEIYEITSNS
jgi:hypothetical protein